MKASGHSPLQWQTRPVRHVEGIKGLQVDVRRHIASGVIDQIIM